MLGLSIKRLLIIFLCLGLSSCAYLEENLKDAPPPPTKVAPPTAREIQFSEAESKYKAGQYDDALPLYLKIASDPSDTNDSIYEHSLLSLAQIYEKTDQSEKAILAYYELQKKDSDVIAKTSLKFALVKNHYRVSNYYQAKTLKTEIDADYKSQKISLSDIFQALYYQTDLYYDRHIGDEMIFVGEIQKYFVYVIEGPNAEQSEKATDLLILYYKKFLGQIDSQNLSPDLKKGLVVSLIDQLSKFDRYRMEGTGGNLSNFNRFSNFAATTQKNLTERLANGKL